MPAYLAPLCIPLHIAAGPYKAFWKFHTVSLCVNLAMTVLIVVGPDIVVVVHF
jgi:hypothetical protein